MNIYQKLVEVRKSVPYLRKDKKGHGFNYVSSSDALGSLKEKMDELGLFLVPKVIDTEIRDHTTAKGGHNYFTILTMSFTWVNADEPEETIECPWHGQGLDSGEKGVGKALTYAEKYFLLKFFNIATDQDDPDSFKEKHSAPSVINEDQKVVLMTVLDESGMSVEDFLKMSKLKSIDDLLASRYDGAIAYLETRVGK